MSYPTTTIIVNIVDSSDDEPETGQPSSDITRAGSPLDAILMARETANRPLMHEFYVAFLEERQRKRTWYVALQQGT